MTIAGPPMLLDLAGDSRGEGVAVRPVTSEGGDHRHININGFDFLAFGASTFGHLHADGVKFLDRVGRCLRDRQLLGQGFLSNVD